MNLTESAQALKSKIEVAIEQIDNVSIEKTHMILEDLSDDMRTAMAQTEMECYDTLAELDFLCEEAEMRSRIKYSNELRSLIVSYEVELSES
ncbi:hypothetical protein OAA09_00860 [bacterium]|nr:hypothetical protein [bacterium]